MNKRKPLQSQKIGVILSLEEMIMNGSINELQTMTYSEACNRVCERVIDMYCTVGDLEDAIAWEWKLTDKLQKGVE